MNRWQKEEAAGKDSIGVMKAKYLGKIMQEEWQEIRHDRREALRERRQAGIHVCMRAQGKEEPLFTAWRTDNKGWSQVEVVLDSGAADTVCPRDMCPQFPVEDSDASKAGVYYTGANGEKLFNLGQTHVPVALDNGVR